MRRVAVDAQPGTAAPATTRPGTQAPETPDAPPQAPTSTPSPSLTADEIVQYSAYLLILALGLLAAFLNTDRTHARSVPRRVFALPADIRPQYAAAHGGAMIGQAAVQRAILAIIFELARRGHLTLTREAGHLAATLHPSPDQSFVQSELSVLEFFATYADELGFIPGPVMKRLLRAAGRQFTMQLRKELAREVQALPQRDASTARPAKLSPFWPLVTVFGIVGWIMAIVLLGEDYAMWPAIAFVGSVFLGIIAAFGLPAYRRGATREQQYWKAYVATLKDAAAYTEAPTEFFEQWDRHLALSMAGLNPRLPDARPPQ